MTEDAAPAEKRTIEEIKSLLLEIPEEVLKPGGCAIDVAKVQGVTKYVYPTLDDTIRQKIQKIIKNNMEMITDVVHTFQVMRSNETKCDNKIEIATIHIEECKSSALYRQIKNMKGQIKRHNTKINSLMNDVDRKREQVTKILTLWDSSGAS